MNKIKILIVDNSKTYTKILFSHFQELEYKVYKANRLKDAKELLVLHKIEYILLSLHLSDGDGEELIDEIKKVSSYVKIMVITADNDIQTRDKIFEKGIIDYFVKSTSIPIIINCADKLIKTIESEKHTNVLTIDDSNFVRNMLKNILISKSYNVFEASNAIDGENIIKNNDIHLILLDLVMPEIDGMQFLEQIKSGEYKDIPVIIISGDSSRENYARVLKQGASDFIRKPFIIEEVLLKCDIHLKSYINEINLKEQQKELKKLNSYHRNLIEASLDPFVMISNKGKITDVNEATINMKGATKDELIGSDFSSYFIEINKAKKIYEKVLKDGKVIDYPLSLKNKDGKIYEVLCNASTYKDENGDIAGIFAAARNVTELNNLRKKSKDIEKLKSNSTLLFNIAHQWRQPLSIISTSASGMQLQKELRMLNDDIFNNSCDTINSTVKELSKTIDDFTTLFNIDSLKENLNLEDIIDEALDKIDDYIKSNNILIIRNITDKSIFSYKNEFLQLISSILENIKEHTKNNKYIFIDIYKDNSNLIIKIKDSGGGIPNDILDKIFEAYFTTQHQSIGKGLGLYTVYQLIKEHFNGNIEVNNIEYNYKNQNLFGVEIVLTIPI